MQWCSENLVRREKKVPHMKNEGEQEERSQNLKLKKSQKFHASIRKLSETHKTTGDNEEFVHPS